MRVIGGARRVAISGLGRNLASRMTRLTYTLISVPETANQRLSWVGVTGGRGEVQRAGQGREGRRRDSRRGSMSRLREKPLTLRTMIPIRSTGDSILRYAHDLSALKPAPKEHPRKQSISNLCASGPEDDSHLAHRTFWRPRRF